MTHPSNESALSAFAEFIDETTDDSLSLVRTGPSDEDSRVSLGLFAHEGQQGPALVAIGSVSSDQATTSLSVHGFLNGDVAEIQVTKFGDSLLLHVSEPTT